MLKNRELAKKRDKVEESVQKLKLEREEFSRKIAAVSDQNEKDEKFKNDIQPELFELEKAGDAYLFVPEHMGVGNGERDVAKLTEAHALGLAQAERELPAWREFLSL